MTKRGALDSEGKCSQTYFIKFPPVEPCTNLTTDINLAASASYEKSDLVLHLTPKPGKICMKIVLLVVTIFSIHRIAGFRE